MKKRRLLLMLLSLMMVAALVIGCGNQEKVETEKVETEKVVLKLNHVMSSSDPAHEAFMKLAENVKKRSNGTFEIQVYGNSELGSNKDNLEQVMRDANIITVGDAGFLADYVPDYGIMNGPFLYESYDDLKKLAASNWHAEIMNKASEKGIKVLAMDWYFGSRNLISDKEIKTPEDLKGMKVRVPSNIMWIETIKSMGGNPTTLQWSEVYSGLSQGVVDAAEAPLSTIYTSKLHETRKKIALTGHFTGIVGLQMSQKLFDELSEENQKILIEEVKAVGEEYSKNVINSEAEWRKKLEAEGVVFNEVDLPAFQKATAEVYTKFPQWSDGLHEKVLKELGR